MDWPVIRRGVLYPRPLNGFAPALFVQIGAPNLKPWRCYDFRLRTPPWTNIARRKFRSLHEISGLSAYFFGELAGKAMTPSGLFDLVKGQGST